MSVQLRHQEDSGTDDDRATGDFYGLTLVQIEAAYLDEFFDIPKQTGSYTDAVLRAARSFRGDVSVLIGAGDSLGTLGRLLDITEGRRDGE